MAATAADALTDYIELADPYDLPADGVADLQLRAVRERLEQRRGQLAIVDQRARDVGVDSIVDWNDLLPLLFSHTTYKSYPDSFVRNGRWDLMLQWYGTLAVDSLSDVDLTGVQDIDDWTAALWAAGHRVHTSSGTSGKCSFIPSGEVDWARSGRIRLTNL
jgi:hypothetical protein